MTTQSTQAAPVEQEPANPILTEIAALDAAGESADIVREIAAMDAADAGTAPPVTPVTPATPVAAVPATETPVATPAVPSPVVPAIDPQVRQYIARLEAQQAQAREAEDQRVLESYTAVQAQAIEQQYGLTPEQARALASQQAQGMWRQFQTERAAQSGVVEAHAKALVAAQMADQFKVPAAALLRYGSPQAMRAAAEALTAQGKRDGEIAALKAEVAALKKNGIPPQTFDNGRPALAAPNNQDALLDQYNMGIRTPETIAAGRRAAGG